MTGVCKQFALGCDVQQQHTGRDRTRPLDTESCTPHLGSIVQLQNMPTALNNGREWMCSEP